MYWVLLADGFLEALQFDFTRLRGEFGGMNEIFFVRVQRLEQGGGKTAGRTEAGAGGNIRHGSQFQPVSVHADHRKGFADDRMFQPGRVRHAFQLRILHDQIRHERVVQGDIDVFVNGRRDEKSAELFVIRRQIRAAAAERDAKRRTRDDHCFR